MPLAPSPIELKAEFPARRGAESKIQCPLHSASWESPMLARSTPFDPAPLRQASAQVHDLAMFRRALGESFLPPGSRFRGWGAGVTRRHVSRSGRRSFRVGAPRRHLRPPGSAPFSEIYPASCPLPDGASCSTWNTRRRSRPTVPGRRCWSSTPLPARVRWRTANEGDPGTPSTSRHGIEFHVKHLGERLDLIGRAGED